jgi:transposase InsO family protein
MPWKKKSKEEQRFDLVRQMSKGRLTVAELSGRFGVSRQTAYKWQKRYRKSQLRGLNDRSCRPLFTAVQTSVGWLRRVREMRQRHRTWGGRKLRHQLVKRFGKKTAPSIATISRYLKRWGLTRGKRRRLRGPQIARKAIRPARACHDVWTADFKGWFRVGDGTRVEPLTVRDLHSRYGLGIDLLPSQTLGPVLKVFQNLFGEHGYPRRIRCDNGTPFGGGGQTGLTRLSAWWLKLGIEVEFITPGRPCENGAHEQFHRVYKAEVALQPEWTVRAQQRRTDKWLRHYNQERPHEALGMRTPAEAFRENRQSQPRRQGPWNYPKGWAQCWVKGSGEISWRGNRRFVGEAFVREYVGLQPNGPGRWSVYFGPLSVGELHENEVGAIRMAKYVPGR